MLHVFALATALARHACWYARPRKARKQLLPSVRLDATAYRDQIGWNQPLDENRSRAGGVRHSGFAEISRKYWNKVLQIIVLIIKESYKKMS